MPPKTSPATIFVFAHRWLVTSIALFAFGLIGISAVAWLAPKPSLAAADNQPASLLPARAVQQATLTPEQSLASTASGIFLFFAIICLVLCN